MDYEGVGAEEDDVTARAVVWWDKRRSQETIRRMGRMSRHLRCMYIRHCEFLKSLTGDHCYKRRAMTISPHTTIGS
jgi:hypothetical protein